MTQIEPYQRGQQGLATPGSMDDFRVLDTYAGGEIDDDDLGVPWIATISAGYKNQAGLPQASRRGDQKLIHMTPEDQQRAPGLYAALEANGFRWLDVAVASNDRRLFLQQHFERRSATRLEVFGDARMLTEIVAERKQDGRGREIWVAKDRRYHRRGEPGYAELVKTCKVSVSFLFTLARWDGQQPKQYWPASDGMGVYRLRFTSRNSLRSLVQSLKQVSIPTRGRLKGLPLRLFPDFRAAADGSGTSRDIVFWNLRFMPPQGLELTGQLWRDLAQQALDQGDLLDLPSVGFEMDGDTEFSQELRQLPVPSQRTVAALTASPPCDAEFYQDAFFGRAKATRYATKAGRAEFLAEYTNGRTDSLIQFLSQATEDEAAALIAELGKRVGREGMAVNARRYEQIFGNDETGTAYDLGDVQLSPEEDAEAQRQIAQADSERPARKTATSAGRVIDTDTGEVVQDNLPGQTTADEIAENKRLVARTRELGVDGAVVAGAATIAQINAELARRIREAELRQQDEPSSDEILAAFSDELDQETATAEQPATAEPQEEMVDVGHPHHTEMMRLFREATPLPIDLGPYEIKWPAPRSEVELKGTTLRALIAKHRPADRSGPRPNSGQRML